MEGTWEHLHVSKSISQCAENYFFFPYLPQSDIAYKRKCDKITVLLTKTKAGISEQEILYWVLYLYYPSSTY